jgi:hypothetical protein
MASFPSTWRRVGKSTIRWLGHSGTDQEFDGLPIGDAISLSVRKWFPSNNSPDGFVLMIVVEREGGRMSEEEAEEYVRRELGIARAAREGPSP